MDQQEGPHLPALQKPVGGGVQMMRAALLTLLIASASPAWAINKCTQPDGSVAFQDAPCAGAGKSEALVVKPASGHTSDGTAASVARTKANVAAINWRFETQAAIERGEPLIGMTVAELDKAMGPPDKANLANYNGTPHNQLIYERGGRTIYVYTDAGTVKAIQNTESIHGAKRVAVRCPSPMEIRAMETSASSITLGELERVERLRQIGEAKKCGR